MTLSAQALNNKSCIQKAAAAENELEELKGKVRRAETFFGSANDRDNLFAGGDASALAVRRTCFATFYRTLFHARFFQVTSMDQRAQVAAGTDKLRHTTDVIRSALRTVECCFCLCVRLYFVECMIKILFVGR